MTDGIIQEVFSQFRNEINDLTYPNNGLKIINLTMLIEQELIEKIKQRFPINYDENYSMWHEAIQKILIGDNQE